MLPLQHVSLEGGMPLPDLDSSEAPRLTSSAVQAMQLSHRCPCSMCVLRLGANAWHDG